MLTPLESDFLVLNGSFLVELLVVVIVIGLLGAGLSWLLTRRRGTTDHVHE